MRAEAIDDDKVRLACENCDWSAVTEWDYATEVSRSHAMPTGHLVWRSEL